MSKGCVVCGDSNHTRFTCPKRPRAALKRSRMKRVGNVGRKLMEQRATFIEENPGPYYCYYCLYVGVEQELPVEQVQIEHFYTKNNHPELRFARENLVLSCPAHNADKGGMDGPEYLAKLDTQMGRTTEWQEHN